MPKSQDPWKLPTLERLGGQLRRLERGDRAGSRHGPGRDPHKLAIAGIVLACLGGIAILSRGGEQADALSPVNRAPGLAARATTVHVRSSMIVTLPGRRTREVREQTDIDFASASYRAVVELIPGGQTLERRFVGGVTYGEASQPTSRHPDVWVAGRVARSRGGLIADADGDTLVEPLSLLRFLAETRARTRYAGSEVIDGVAVRRYMVFTDLASLLRTGRPYEAQPASYRSVSAVLTVWLDRHGRPRRVTARLTGRSARGEAYIASTVDFSRFGDRVRIHSPAAAHVAAHLQGNHRRLLSYEPTRLLARSIFANRQPPSAAPKPSWSRGHAPR